MASHTADFATPRFKSGERLPRRAKKVFRAWTELEALDRWMCRDVPTHEVKYLETQRANGRALPN